METVMFHQPLFKIKQKNTHFSQCHVNLFNFTEKMKTRAIALLLTSVLRQHNNHGKLNWSAA